MRIEQIGLAGVYLLVGEPVTDERGAFVRVHDAPLLAEFGLETSFPQRAQAINHRAGTLRGLHYAADPHAETKIISIYSGSVYDVVVDLRPDSTTCGNWFSTELRAQSFTSLYVPRGCAHGYQTLTAETIVGYDLSSSYVAQAARGIRYDDPSLAIAWPLAVASISGRDLGLPTLESAGFPRTRTRHRP